ncbi:phosphoribosyltransferase [Aurantiacibacter marinus]|uniref:Phosphoribosyltransferase n=1 Tax=Aurantiacibacter marinus TaxID=874156 RepID=A0A0H0XSL2_9SPHN|nr:phosphoribosyltransferase [Aurantiacibacter marinus]KLI65304.1 phosphoribosyltransferase [Aurantiacibacter marinus]
MTFRPFANRREAGRMLAQEILKLNLMNAVVLALPRGGVPLGYEVAKALGAPLDVLFVRKIGAPGHEEYGIGALVDGVSPQVFIDRDIARMVGADEEYIAREVERQLAEIERRRRLYRPGPPVELRGRTAVVVDDGIATGGTARAALQALAKSGVKAIVLAVAVAPASTLRELSPLCDRLVCLLSPEPFNAVGAHYTDFAQTGDDEVVRLLNAANSAPGSPES